MIEQLHQDFLNAWMHCKRNPHRKCCDSPCYFVSPQSPCDFYCHCQHACNSNKIYWLCQQLALLVNFAAYWPIKSTGIGTAFLSVVGGNYCCSITVKFTIEPHKNYWLTTANSRFECTGIGCKICRDTVGRKNNAGNYQYFLWKIFAVVTGIIPAIKGCNIYSKNEIKSASEAWLL